MKKTMRSVFLLLSILALLFMLSPGRTARASTGCTWLGSMNANWSTGANWTPGCSGVGGAPGTGDTLTFPNGGSNQSMNDDLPAIMLTELIFQGVTGYTLNGTNSISIINGISVQGGTQAVNAPLVVVNNTAIFQAASGSSLALNGTVAIGTYTLTVTVNTNAGVVGVSFHNLITGGPDFFHQGKIVKNGTGDLQFLGNNNAQFWGIDVNAGSISTTTTPGAWTFMPYNGLITLASGTLLNIPRSAIIGPLAGAGDVHTGSAWQIRENMDTTFTGDITGYGQMAIFSNGVQTFTIDRSGGTLSYHGEIMIGSGPAFVRLINTDATTATDFSVLNRYGNSELELVNSSVGLVMLGNEYGPDNINGGTLKLSGTGASSVSQVVLQSDTNSIVSVLNSTVDYGHMTEALPIDFAGYPLAFALSGSGKPQPGFVYEIIDNTGGGTATGSGAAFSGLPQDGWLVSNNGAVKADYQAEGNTAFTLTGGTALFLPLGFRQ